MGMMTLNEYAKSLDTSNSSRSFIEMFAASSDVFSALRFEGLTGPVYEGYRTAELPSIGFRAINEASTTGAGKITPFQEATFRMDHDIDIDVAITDRMGDANFARHEKLGITAAGRRWIDTFIGGDNGTEPREFNGIQARSALNSRTTHNSAASGGAALSLLKLDQAINETANPTHIMAPFASKPLWIQAARTTTLTGFIMHGDLDDVGKVQMSYAGLPFLWGYPKDDHAPILAFDEVGSGGGSAVTASLYILSLGEDGLFGIQIKPLTATGPELLEDKITRRTHISWDVGMVDGHKYSMHRLASWTNAAIVA